MSRRVARGELHRWTERVRRSASDAPAHPPGSRTGEEVVVIGVTNSADSPSVELRRAPIASDRIGDFRIVREIGRGGMGIVYLARQISLGRQVALKILPPQLTGDPERLQRFKREAAVISRLDHDCIVPVYAVGEENGVHYIAMKYLEGETLETLIARKRSAVDEVERPCPQAPTEVLDAPEVDPRASEWMRDEGEEAVAVVSEGSDAGWIYRCLRIAERVALALHHAHGRGIIHRDVKPANIFIDQEGEPWLLDFGLVRDLEMGTLTESQGILGTAYYMAPETVTNDRELADHRVDVYALAATLYEMVTLRRPFDYDSPDTLFHCIVHEEPTSPRAFNPQLSRDVCTVLLRGLEKAPAARFPSAQEFAMDLGRIRRFEPIISRPSGVLLRLKRWIHRNPAIAAALLFSLLSFVGMIEYTVYERRKADQRRERTLVLARQAEREGRWREALDSYRLFIALGGEEEEVHDRMRAAEEADRARKPR